MERKVHLVNKRPPKPKMLRVVGYARVSSGKDAMLHSLASQIDYFQNLIKNHAGWEFCGVYADEAVTGTKEKRPQFQKMLEKCRNHEVDLIITKAISRFARNTVTLLETVRELKNLGIDVWFEKENLHSISSDGELMLSILASFAQEESKSVSDNIKWRIQSNFKEGMPWNATLLGYRYENGVLIIEPEEAEIVRFIFNSYLDGAGAQKIANELNARGKITRKSCKWHKNSVIKILCNYTYTGNLLLQTTFLENHITKKPMKNEGQLPKYHVEDAHEAIIPMEQYLAVRRPIGGKDQNALFLSARDQRISRSNVHALVKKRLSQAGLDSAQYSSHKLRHTAATLMLQNGVDVKAVQEVLGHEHLNTTEIYTHIDNEALRVAARANPLGKVKPKK